MQVAAMLRGSENVIQNPEEELTPAEQRALKAMDLEEVCLCNLYALVTKNYCS